MMKKAALVIIPMPAIGHLAPITEFARRLLDRDDRFSVTILLFRIPSIPDVESYSQSLAVSDSRIQFLDIPEVNPPTNSSDQSPFGLQEALKSPVKFVSMFIDAQRSHVKDAITDHVLSNQSVTLVGLVIDMPCCSMVDVGNDLGVPCYRFLSSGSTFQGCVQYLVDHPEFQESQSDVIIPSFLNPVPSSVFPSFLLTKEGREMLQDHARRWTGAKGIIVNTFLELESHAATAIRGDDKTPIYTVGPLLSLKGQRQSIEALQRDEIMKWLDDQPPQSVVFLCFGSMGSFDETQLKEIAVGLERSGQRFLWSIRKPPLNDYSDILPEGFLERTKDRGTVCGWAPQLEVLAHEGIGGFVSHCGWNSILESLWYGVPIVTWPMYAEQQLNAFQMVKDLRLAEEMRLDFRQHSSDFVKADEIENAIKRVMDRDSELRKRVKDTSEIGRKAVVEGGSSFAAFGRLIEDMLGN